MIIELRDLNKIRNKEKNKKIILATGTFNLFHYEHLKYLEDAKMLGDILVVAIKNNECASLKGKDRPVIDEKQRVAIVDAIKYVDYVVLVSYGNSQTIYDNEMQRQWLCMFEEVFKTLKPDVLYHEDNLALKTARERIFEKYNIKGISRKRAETISTTKIIKKLRNY